MSKASVRNAKTEPLIVLKQALILLAVLASAGCFSLPGGDKGKAPLSIYTLHPPPPGTQHSSTTNPAPVVVFVSKPELPEGFESERITLLFEKGHRLDYYANAKWSARLDDLLQDFIAQMARHVLPDRIAATKTPAAGARYKLTVKITDFQPVYQTAADSPPQLDVAMTVTLVTLPDETVKTQFSLKKSAPCSANTMTTVIKELESLLQSLTMEALQKIAPSM